MRVGSIRLVGCGAVWSTSNDKVGKSDSADARLST
jgi:hypothetical protein